MTAAIRWLRPLLVATGCALLVGGTAALTAERINTARTAELRTRLAALVGPDRAATIREPLRWPLILCEERSLLAVRGRGYGGPLELLLALEPAAGGRIAALTVHQHAETPGIGDFISASGDDAWLHRFVGSTKTSLATRAMTVDAVAGATITVRAIRRALAGALAEPTQFTARLCPQPETRG